jgi:two-component system response regulator MprA
MVAASRNVLIIEDDPDIRAAIADALALEGHAVAEAADGLEGLEQAHEHRPDLILLDLMMPRMDGWAFRDAQQADAGLADVPVVIVSACMADEVHSLGAAGHLHKPFNMNELLEVVGRFASAA